MTYKPTFTALTIAAQFMKFRTFDAYMKPGATNGLTDGANFASGGEGVLDEDSSHGIVSDALRFNLLYIYSSSFVFFHFSTLISKFHFSNVLCNTVNIDH